MLVAALPHGEFTTMVESELPFGESAARKFMLIANDKRLSKRSHVNVLPTSWGTLYELTTLSDEQFEEALDAEIIRPDMERKDLAPIKAKAKRRLADEYDAAQERGEVGQQTGRPPKVVPDQNDFVPSAADIGLSRKEIHEARLVRDAEGRLPVHLEKHLSTGCWIGFRSQCGRKAS